jgi:hypothetical protein
MGTGDNFSGLKRPGREADHLLPSTAQVKNGGARTPLPHVSSWNNLFIVEEIFL